MIEGVRITPTRVGPGLCADGVKVLRMPWKGLLQGRLYVTF